MYKEQQLTTEEAAIVIYLMKKFAPNLVKQGIEYMYLNLVGIYAFSCRPNNNVTKYIPINECVDVVMHKAALSGVDPSSLTWQQQLKIINSLEKNIMVSFESYEKNVPYLNYKIKWLNEFYNL